MKRSSEKPEPVYLDANLFVYADLATDRVGESAREVIGRMVEREFRGLTSVLTIDEVMWSIWSEEDMSRGVKVGRSILKLANLELLEVDRDDIQRAIDSVESHGLTPRDAVHYASMSSEDLTIIVSDDSDFKNVPGIERVGIAEFSEKFG